MAAIAETPSWRRRRWSRIETIAWIVWRQSEAVERASALSSAQPELPSRCVDPLTALAVLAALPRSSQIAEITDPAAAIAEADAQLRELETTGRLVPDSKRSYSRAAVQRLFQSKEGRGKGQQKRPYADAWKIRQLGLHLLAVAPEEPTRAAAATRRGPEPNKQTALTKLYAWCEAKALISKSDHFAPLRRKALTWAERELEARIRHGFGLANWCEPSEREFANARTNLDAWKSLSTRWRQAVHTLGE